MSSEKSPTGPVNHSTSRPLERGVVAAVSEATKRADHQDERWQALAEATGQLIWTTPPDGMVEDIPSWRAFTGQTAAQVQGWGWLDAVHPADRAAISAAWSAAISARSPFTTTFRLRRADGVFRDFQARAVPVREATGAVREWVGCSVDITEQHHLENTLRAHLTELADVHRQTRIILESITDAFFALDATWRFTYLNPQAEPLLQRPLGELLGRNVWDEFPEAVGTQFYDEYQRVQKRQVASTFIALFPPLATWFEVHAYPAADGGIAVYFRDATDRVRMDAEREALLASERAARQTAEAASQQLQTVLDVLPAGVSIVDAHGKIVAMNPAFYAVWGENSPQSQGVEDYQEYQGWHPDGSPLAADEWTMARALQHGQTIFNEEIDILNFRGEHRTIINNAAPIRDATGTITGAVVALIDNTERKRLTQQAEDRARTLATTFAAMTDAVVIYDAAGNMVEVNPATYSILGFDVAGDYLKSSPAERWRQLAPRTARGDLLPEQEWPVNRLLRGEIMIDANTEAVYCQTMDGRSVILNFSGAPLYDDQMHIIGAVLVMRDVTAARRLEVQTTEALAALIDLAESLVLNDAQFAHLPAPEKMALVGGRLAELGRRVMHCRRVGLTMYDPASDTIQPIAVVGLAESDTDAWHTGTAGRRLREHIAAPQLAEFLAGETLVIELKNSELLEQWQNFVTPKVVLAPMLVEGQLVGTMSLDFGMEPHTITPAELALAGTVANLMALVIERERLQREREEALARAQALEETTRRMDEFLGIASHELRTPVTSLKITIQSVARQLRQIASNEAADPARVLARVQAMQGRLEHTDSALDRLNRLVGELLDMVRQQAGMLELQIAEVDLTQLANETVQEQALIWPDRVLRLSTEPGICVMGDSDRLGQVMQNFLSNALKYAYIDQPINIELRRRENQAWFGVRDTGPGLSAAQQERLWQRFYRVAGIEQQQNSAMGLGLGLFICKSIIERHGGQVGITSVPGTGSTFWFTVPLANPAPNQPA